MHLARIAGFYSCSNLQHASSFVQMHTKKQLEGLSLEEMVTKKKRANDTELAKNIKKQRLLLFALFYLL